MNEFRNIDRLSEDHRLVVPRVERIPTKLPEKQPETSKPKIETDTVEISEEAMELLKQQQENQKSHDETE